MALLGRALWSRRATCWVASLAAGTTAAGWGCSALLAPEPHHKILPDDGGVGAELVRACAADDERRALQLLGGASSAGVRGACSYRDATKRTPISHAAEKGLRNVVAAMLEAHAWGNLIDAPNRHGVTPLEYACWRGHAQVVRMLLDAGSAALNTPDHFGVRPLHKTVAFHRVAVLRTTH